MKRVLTLAAVALAALLAWEFGWRWQHTLLKPQAAAPDERLVAEVRSLPDARRSTGVYLRGRWELLRALRPRLVFLGECDEVDTRWFGPRRLVIECELRSGEPQLLQEIVDGAVIEVIVQRRFALPAPRPPGEPSLAGLGSRWPAPRPGSGPDHLVCLARAEQVPHLFGQRAEDAPGQAGLLAAEDDAVAAEFARGAGDGFGAAPHQHGTGVRDARRVEQRACVLQVLLARLALQVQQFTGAEEHRDVT